ncbi:MAG: serine hydroxymethyltransferase [Candidatus Parcubacteria bacterium]|nr:serine hydroxymethyltransferase [Candidatus Paceibacterota bacterium]
MPNFVTDLTQEESLRQRNTLNLIASENYPSPKCLDLTGSQWSLKYGEGYPGKRYYAGNNLVDELELFVMQKALEVFKAQDEYGVNLQVLSGSVANSLVYLSCLQPQDKILSLSLADGGHLSHMHDTSSWNKFFEHQTYGLTQIGERDWQIDLGEYEAKIAEFKPKLVIVGFSSYPKKFDFVPMCQIAHQHGAMVLADIAHISGLVASGLHSTPFGYGVDGADFVATTTHKTLRGPRGAMLFAKNYRPDYASSLPDKPLIDIVNRTVFPGLLGGPNFAQIASVGQCLLEVLGSEQYPDKLTFGEYSQRVLTNTKLLEKTLKSLGQNIVSPTETHLCLIELKDTYDSLHIQQELESIGVIVNRNTIPGDKKTAWKPSGLRFGMPALTSRGISEDQIVELANIINETIENLSAKHILIERVHNITNKLNWWYDKNISTEETFDLLDDIKFE